MHASTIFSTKEYKYHPIGYQRLRYMVMNIIAKLSALVTAMLDRNAVDAAPATTWVRRWAEGLSRAVGLPVSRRRRLASMHRAGGTGR